MLKNLSCIFSPALKNQKTPERIGRGSINDDTKLIIVDTVLY